MICQILVQESCGLGFLAFATIFAHFEYKYGKSQVGIFLHLSGNEVKYTRESFIQLHGRLGELKSSFLWFHTFQEGKEKQIAAED